MALKRSNNLADRNIFRPNGDKGIVSNDVGEYIRYAVEHGRGTMEGDAKATNAAHDRLQEVFKSIVNKGQGESLLSLFDHSNAWVRLWSASHALEISPAQALAKLEELEKADIPVVSLDAHYVIEEWNIGELHFLP